MIINAVEDISTNFYLLNAVVVVGLIFYLLWRKPRTQARFRMPENLPKKGLKGLAQELKDMKDEDIAPVQEEPAQLNVMFNWNGHTWDAYEVLGVPAGSTLKQVEQAFEAEITKMDDESRAFIRKAYQAIVDHKNG